MTLMTGVGWYGHVLRRADGRNAHENLWRPGWAIRRDWPDGGHDFSGFRVAPGDMDRQIERDRAYWRRGPVKPLTWSIVQISRRDLLLHTRQRLLCRAPDCPTAQAEPVPVEEVTR